MREAKNRADLCEWHQKANCEQQRLGPEIRNAATEMYAIVAEHSCSRAAPSHAQLALSLVFDPSPGGRPCVWGGARADRARFWRIELYAFGMPGHSAARDRPALCL